MIIIEVPSPYIKPSCGGPPHYVHGNLHSMNHFTESVCDIDVNVAELGGNVAFIGTALSSFLSGVIICQTFNYIHSNKDGWLLRGMVLLTIVADLGGTVANNLFLYHFAIVHFGDLSRIVPYIEQNIFFAVEVLLSLVVVFLVELFFARCVYLLNRTHWIVPSVIAISACAAFVMGLVACIRQSKNTHFTFSRQSKLDFGLSAALSALSDVLVTIAIWWSFFRSRTGFRQVDSLMKKLIEYTVTRGVLVTVFQVIYLAVFLAMTTSLHWVPFQLIMSKVYVITMMAMLNSRTSLRRRTNPSSAISALRFAEGTDTSNGRSVTVSATNTQEATSSNKRETQHISSAQEVGVAH